jgi:hypothetical protein
VTPANPPSRFWTQTTPTTTHPSPPCLPDHRRDVATVQITPEACRSSMSGRISGELAGTLARAGEHLSMLFVTVRLRSSGSDRST